MKPHPDDGFMRGIGYGLILSLALWAFILWMVFSGWNVG